MKTGVLYIKQDPFTMRNKKPASGFLSFHHFLDRVVDLSDGFMIAGLDGVNDAVVQMFLEDQL